MNRLLSIAGFLAAGTTAFMVWLILCVPWIPLYSSSAPTPLGHWLLWGALSLFGIGIVYAFARYSTRSHWAALRHNTALSTTAWRGACGSYVLLTILFGFVVYDWPVNHHPIEMFSYAGLLVAGLWFVALSIHRGFMRTTSMGVETSH